MTEHVLTWFPKVPGPGETAATAVDDSLRLVGMPTGLVRPARQALAADHLTAAARAVVQQVLAELRQRVTEPDLPPARIDLGVLDENDKAVVADILGEGDVWAKVGLGDAFCRIVESVLAGTWRLESSKADGTRDRMDRGRRSAPAGPARRGGNDARPGADTRADAPGYHERARAAVRTAGTLGDVPARRGKPRHQLHAAAVDGSRRAGAHPRCSARFRW